MYCTRKLATICSGPHSQIFAETVSNIPHQVLVQLPKEERVKRTIRKHGCYNDPTKPGL